MIIFFTTPCLIKERLITSCQRKSWRNYAWTSLANIMTFNFDSGRVRCIGLIKDLVVILDQILVKNVLMDVFVAYIPPRFGILLSRSWGEKLKRSLKLDFSYATIPMFRQMRKLYREKNMKYMITSKEKPMNHPINYVYIDLEPFVLYSDSGFNGVNSQLAEVEDIPEITENFRAVLHQERQRLESTAELSTFH